MKAFVLSLLASVVAATGTAQRISYRDHALWKVYPATAVHQQALQLLAEAGTIDAWGHIERGTADTPVLVRVPPAAAKPLSLVLGELGVRADVVASDLDKMIQDESADPIDPADPADPVQRVQPGSSANQQAVLAAIPQNVPVSSAPSFFSNYHTLEEYHAYFDSLVAKYPAIVTPFSIGSSYEKRDIKGIKIHVPSPTNSTKREMIFHGGMHAREWIGPAVVSYITTELLDKYGRDDDVTKLLDTFDFSIIPVLNVDGFVYTHKTDRMWRKTRRPNAGSSCIGTDPNRNWPYAWGTGGSSKDPCSDAYMGPKPFSEQEPAQMSAYIESLGTKPISYIDFHAFSQLWMYPPGNTCTLPVHNAALKRVATAAATALESVHNTPYTVGTICKTIYQASGSSVDHTYNTFGLVYSFAVELRDTGDYGFLLPKRFIIPSGQETFAAYVAMGLAIIKEEKL
eukprot:jgi/Hompol1/5086/HPOL_004148-RA